MEELAVSMPPFVSESDVIMAQVHHLVHPTACDKPLLCLTTSAFGQRFPQKKTVSAIVAAREKEGTGPLTHLITSCKV